MISSKCPYHGYDSVRSETGKERGMGLCYRYDECRVLIFLLGTEIEDKG